MELALGPGGPRLVKRSLSRYQVCHLTLRPSDDQFQRFGMFLSMKWQPTPVFLPGKSHGSLQSVGSQRVGHDWVTEPTHTLSMNAGVKMGAATPNGNIRRGAQWKTYLKQQLLTRKKKKSKQRVNEWVSALPGTSENFLSWMSSITTQV